MTKPQLKKLQEAYLKASETMDDMLNAMQKENTHQFAFYAGQWIINSKPLEAQYGEEMYDVINNMIGGYNFFYRKNITREEFNNFWIKVVVDCC